MLAHQAPVPAAERAPEQLQYVRCRPALARAAAIAAAKAAAAAGRRVGRVDRVDQAYQRGGVICDVCLDGLKGTVGERFGVFLGGLRVWVWTRRW